jgi:hypothetical protein
VRVYFEGRRSMYRINDEVNHQDDRFLTEIESESRSNGS